MELGHQEVENSCLCFSHNCRFEIGVISHQYMIYDRTVTVQRVLAWVTSRWGIHGKLQQALLKCIFPAALLLSHILAFIHCFNLSYLSSADPQCQEFCATSCYKILWTLYSPQWSRKMLEIFYLFQFQPYWCYASGVMCLCWTHEDQSCDLTSLVTW